MAKEKPGVMMYWETFDVLEALLDGQAKTMLRAIRNYSQYGEAPDFGCDTVLATLWMLFQPKLDADNERYEQIRKKRRQAINTRWQREREERTDEYGSIQEYTNEYKTYGSIQNIPTTTTASTTTTTTASTATPDPDSNSNSDSASTSNPDSFTDPEPVYKGKMDSYNESQKGRMDCASAPSTRNYKELLSFESLDSETEQEAEQMKQEAIEKLSRYTQGV